MRTHVSPQAAKAALGCRFKHVKHGVRADVFFAGEWRRYGYDKASGYWFEPTPAGAQIRSALHDGLVKY